MLLPTTQVSGLAINNRFIVCQYWVQPEIGQFVQARRCFLELCSENTFSHLCSHQFVQVRKYFLEFCSENTYPQLCSHEAASSCCDCWKDTSTEDRLFLYDLELELCQRRKYLNIMIMSQSEVKFMCVDQRCNDFQPQNTICE